MNFSCEKALLVGAISTASRTVAPKSKIHALEGLYLRAGDSGLLLTGYNLETGISVRVPAEVREDGDCIFPTRLFFDIIRKLPDEIVHIEVNENWQAVIRCGISKFRISVESAEDYPELPEVEFTNAIHIPQRIMKDLINGTIFSVSDNLSRPIHTGCRIEVAQDLVTMVAVDGFRLAKRTYRLEESTQRDLAFVVPAVALREVEKILSDVEGNMKFSLGRKHILFEIGDATLICRILEGDFLDWRGVIPKNNPIVLTACTSDLMAAIERVGLIISVKVKSPVRCRFRDNAVELHTTTTIGEARDRCELSGDGKDLEIGFNCSYLLEALRAIECESVVLELSSTLTPLVLRPADEKLDFTYMVLPVRIRTEEGT